MFGLLGRDVSYLYHIIGYPDSDLPTRGSQTYIISHECCNLIDQNSLSMIKANLWPVEDII